MAQAFCSISFVPSIASIFFSSLSWMLIYFVVMRKGQEGGGGAVAQIRSVRQQ